MKAIAFSATLALAAATPMSEGDYQREFASWMTKHGKTYETNELFYRYGVFKDNWDFIEKHNADETQTFKMATNQFSDLTEHEFGRIYGSGLLPKESREHRPLKEGKAKCTSFSGTTAEKTVDWVAKGKVTKVKNQGQCGSCWSFSSTGSLEAATAISTGKDPVPLSEQQLMDCSWGYGNMGCNGGLMDDAFEYWIDNGGACTEESYPYTAESSHTCRPCTKVATVKSCQDVSPQNPNELKAAVAQHPVSIAIQANQRAFQMYHSGVLTGLCGHQR